MTRVQSALLNKFGVEANGRMETGVVEVGVQTAAIGLVEIGIMALLGINREGGITVEAGQGDLGRIQTALDGTTLETGLPEV